MDAASGNRRLQAGRLSETVMQVVASSFAFRLTAPFAKYSAHSDVGHAVLHWRATLGFEVRSLCGFDRLVPGQPSGGAAVRRCAWSDRQPAISHPCPGAKFPALPFEKPGSDGEVQASHSRGRARGGHNLRPSTNGKLFAMIIFRSNVVLLPDHLIPAGIASPAIHPRSNF